MLGRLNRDTNNKWQKGEKSCHGLATQYPPTLLRYLAPWNHSDPSASRELLVAAVGADL